MHARNCAKNVHGFVQLISHKKTTMRYLFFIPIYMYGNRITKAYKTCLGHITIKGSKIHNFSHHAALTPFLAANSGSNISMRHWLP